MGLLDEQLIAVEVGRALVAERVLRVGIAGPAGALGGPFLVELAGLLGLAGDEGDAGLVVVLDVAERLGRVADEVAEVFKQADVVEPPALECGVGLKQLALTGERLLLAVGPIERVAVAEELLAVRFADLPRWVADDRVEAGALLGENVGELELPVEEALRAWQSSRTTARPRVGARAASPASAPRSAGRAARTTGRTTGRSASRTRARAGSGKICLRHMLGALVGLRRGHLAQAAVELAHACDARPSSSSSEAPGGQEPFVWPVISSTCSSTISLRLSLRPRPRRRPRG
jgi:hypothetical protein